MVVSFVLFALERLGVWGVFCDSMLSFCSFLFSLFPLLCCIVHCLMTAERTKKPGLEILLFPFLIFQTIIPHLHGMPGLQCVRGSGCILYLGGNVFVYVLSLLSLSTFSPLLCCY